MSMNKNAYKTLNSAGHEVQDSAAKTVIKSVNVEQATNANRQDDTNGPENAQHPANFDQNVPRLSINDRLAAQIGKNDAILNELDILRKNQKLFERAMKEKEFFKQKFQAASEQITCLKRKLGNNENDTKNKTVRNNENEQNKENEQNIENEQNNGGLQ